MEDGRKQTGQMLCHNADLYPLIPTSVHISFEHLSPITPLLRYQMDPVLVLGGCGGLGHHIVQQLLDTKKASDVTAFDIRDVNRVPGAKYVQGSIASKEDVRSLLETVTPKVIFHTISPTLMGQKNTQKLYEDVEGTCSGKHG